MFPDKPAGIVTVLLIVAFISSNKNIMHREENVEKIKVHYGWMDQIMAHIFGPCSYECFISQASVRSVATLASGLYKK